MAEPRIGINNETQGRPDREYQRRIHDDGTQRVANGKQFSGFDQFRTTPALVAGD